MSPHVRINHQIKAPELRVIGPEGENFGVITLGEALAKANEAGVDLIEISPNAVPPVAKIMDFGKYQYAENKKQKASKAKAHTAEVKTLQIKIGTGEHDLSLKAKKAGEWLREGHRVRLDLFLPGRAKYLNEAFLKERVARFLKLVPEDYIMADTPKKSPKGMTAIIERTK
ncbi:MAG: translation initiation factor IF-3 [Candidatus Zambryskibacteria bacterium RIFCSPHIGHO2_01_FULL_43_27]|nr:MAG: translation initiation factor IF-3 [Candidatus Zambryskibacteria bacterium RIFCSPHIGHO2_01_FULL_43_27]